MSKFADALRTKAAQARRAAANFSNDKAACGMLALANEYEDRAKQIEASGAPQFRRIIYISNARPDLKREDIDTLLLQCRANNGIDGVSGLLWVDKSRFIQLLEGPPTSVENTFTSIKNDIRHEGIEVIFDELVTERAFADWSMAHLPRDRDPLFDRHLEKMLAASSYKIRQVFASLS